MGRDGRSRKGSVGGRPHLSLVSHEQWCLKDQRALTWKQFPALLFSVSIFNQITSSFWADLARLGLQAIILWLSGSGKVRCWHFSFPSHLTSGLTHQVACSLLSPVHHPGPSWRRSLGAFSISVHRALALAGVQAVLACDTHCVTAPIAF